MSQFGLLRARRFGPFFWTQFFGAFNDNVFKNAVVMLFALHPPRDLGLSLGTLSNLATGLLVLPFFLFSAISGQLADKFEKSKLIRATKVFEVILMGCACVGFFLHSGIFLLSVVFLLGVQATLFGPAKYAILPQVLREEELVGGNGLIEMGTYVAILLGTVVGGALMNAGALGEEATSAAVVVFAVIGYLAARRIPRAEAAAPDLAIRFNLFRETRATIRIAKERRDVWIAILGNSWFWFYGATVLSQFPAFTKDVLGGSESMITLMLTLFALGIGIGSLLCERLSRGKIELGLVPLGAIGMFVFGLDLFFASSGLPRPTGTATFATFVSDPARLRVFFDLAMLGAFGGVYSVPLYALMQHRSDPEKRSRVVAANNIVNSAWMVGSSAMAIGLLRAGLSVPQLFLVTVVLHAIFAAYLFASFPEFLRRFRAWLAGPRG